MSSFLNKISQAANSNSNSNSNDGSLANNNNDSGMTANNSTASANTGSNQSEDYGDKGLDFLEKKSGHTLSRDTNEKITDGARNEFEKLTGKNVPSKFSN